MTPTEQSNTTPRPWPNADGWADSGNQAGGTLIISDEDYEFARQCVNEHDALVAVAEAAQDFASGKQGSGAAITKALATLAALRKGQQ